MANVSTVRNIKLRADELEIHPTAQRAVNHTRVKKLSADLDLDAIGVVHAVQYPINGKNGPWVVDGQHRIYALIDAGCGEWPVDVMVHLEVKDDKRASDLFLHLNNRIVVNPIDKFKNELKAKHEEAVGIFDVLTVRGLKLATTATNEAICCVTSLRKSYRMDAGRSLADALVVVNEAWGKSAAAHDGKLIEGLAFLIAKNRNEVDLKHLGDKLRRYAGGPSALVGSAKGRMAYSGLSLSKSLAAVVCDMYNANRKNQKLEVA